MNKNKTITDEQASKAVGGSVIDVPVYMEKRYILVLYCEKDDSSITKEVQVLVPEGTSPYEAARNWCEANNKTYLDWRTVVDTI